jgi:octaprenyl-diphosphate synthase
MDDILAYLGESEGKRVRPALTLLASRFHPNDGERAITMATATELLHLATLVHDDTVDGASTRRGRATISERWGSHVAVLVGDFVFATAATFVCDTGNVRVIRRFSEAIMELASGQLMEYRSTFKPQTRSEYEDRIYRKTASLIQTATECGAVLSDASEPVIEALKGYGYHLGMAFQIVDDILDVEGDPEETGKPVGSDLRNGVLTLPTLLLTERYPLDNPVLRYFQSRDERDADEAMRMVRAEGLIEKSYVAVRDHVRCATKAIGCLPDTPERTALETLAQYVWERRK